MLNAIGEKINPDLNLALLNQIKYQMNIALSKRV